jgi:fatty acid desaturase
MLPTLTEPATRGSDFASLRRAITAAGLLERRRFSYAVRILLTLSGLAAAYWLVTVIGSSWWQLGMAAVLGVIYTQLAFLGHDGGHQQVARTRFVNDMLGIVAGDLLVGLSFGWWLDKHNRHHAKPNHEGYDPDIGDGVLAFTTGQVADRTGTVGRVIVRHQAWLFFPLLMLEGLNLHVASIRAVLSGAFTRYRRLEVTLLSLHIVGYLAAVFTLMSPAVGFAFIAVHQAVFGLYMGCSFAPNHKGMPTFPDSAQLDYLRRQVLTSRNVRGPRWVDGVLGGLNFQVEHHLFPSMPRPNLRKAAPIIRNFCAERRVLYTEVGVLTSYRVTLAHLHRLGHPLRG